MSMKAALATLCILLFVAFVQSEDRPPYKDGDEVHGTKDLILVSKLKRNVIDLKQKLIWFTVITFLNFGMNKILMKCRQ